ncbi:MAG TPA: zinc-binding dehydrogenase [Vicinamibacterales bacterium]|nr:zinc-binding dehydrogenase [Vicinamibacterales bacterium]
MKAIVRQQFGGPEQLAIREVPDPDPMPGHVVIQVKAFGLNHAELYMRKGDWGDVAAISGIECVGVVAADVDGRFPRGQTVAAVMGGMGRTINGSYAEYTRVPSTHVVPLDSALPWEHLAPIPEVYATAWSCLFGNLDLAAGQRLLIRGATSALGQAALNIAAHAGAEVIATTRNRDRFATLESLGAKRVELEGADLSRRIRAVYPAGIDAVLELVGNSTLVDSLNTLRRGGRLVLAGFLGGLAPIASFNPLFQVPSGVHFSFFGSFAYGTPQFPLAEVPLQTIVDRAAAGIYQAKPARVFRFEDIQDAHRLMESNQANGKIVVTLDATQ